MVRLLYHEPEAEAHGCAEQLNQDLVQFGSILLQLQFGDYYRKCKKWWPNLELNQGHADFQSAALPTELFGHIYF